MLDTLDLNRSLDKDTYRTQVEQFMKQLRRLQKDCWDKKLPVIVVLEGWAAAGKGRLVKKMVQYMDPRGFRVHPVWPPTDVESQYPLLWRFWEKLPADGSLGVFYHSWYTHVLEDRLFGRTGEAEIPGLMGQLNAFERQLVDSGTAIAKFWIHLSRKELKTRLKDYANHPLESWRVRPEDWKQAKHYKHYCTLAEEMLIHTSTGHAPWTLVEGDCQRWSNVKVLAQLAATLTESLDRLQAQTPPPVLTPQAKLDPTEPDFLAEVDLNKRMTQEEYKAKLREEQVKLRQLQLAIFTQNIPVLIVFEGWDAAGKGGAIKRLTDTLDPRSYYVTPFAAPNDEEKCHHYLWRFWRRLPRAGKIGIFDRSWYGRVMVERIERFASEPEWRRAYREINEFEAQLISAGYVLVKFWLHISSEEQLQRFEDRKTDPFRSYKLTEEDWRNREQWPLYEVAVNQMIQRTSTPQTPWTIVPANNKYFARVKVIQTVTRAIEHRLR